MIFVSYSRDDVDSVRLIVEGLRNSGNECWLDEKDIPVGEAFVRHLGTGLFESAYYLLIDTESSRTSYWVERERTVALRQKRLSSRFKIARIGNLAWNESDPFDISVPFTEGGISKLQDFFHFLKKEDTHSSYLLKPVDQNLRFGEFGQPQNWIGRQDELRYLDKWWMNDKKGAWLQGLGGAGKSGLLQTWVAALDILGYEKLGQISILYMNGRYDIERLRNSFFKFQQQSRSVNYSIAVLDGFDEASDKEVMVQFLGNILEDKTKLLVSSRSPAPEYLKDLFHNIALGSMPNRDAIKFSLAAGIDEHNSQIVAEKLGGLPLAMQIFTKYVSTSKDGDVEEAIKALDRAQASLSSGNAQPSNDLRSSISQSVGLLSESAVSLIKNIVAANESEIPWPHQFSGFDHDLLEQSLYELSKASLVVVDDIDKPSNVRIHPLIRAYFTELNEKSPNKTMHPTV